MDIINGGEHFQAMATSAVRIPDGNFDFSYGCDSSWVTTVASQTTPQGLPRNALAWMDNATVRGGGIQQRNGWLKLFLAAAQGSGNYQGGFLYVPTNGTVPYLILFVGGVIWQCLLDGSMTVVNLSAAFNLFNPPVPPQVWMEQGEEFLVIQAGDFLTAATPTLPLFWDGNTLRRSNGLAPPIPGQTQYVLTTLAGWVVPAVGMKVTILLNSNYPGAVGDQITWGNYGTFTVTDLTTPDAPVLTTVSTTLAGATVPAGSYPVTAVNIPVPVPYTIHLVNGWTGPGVSTAVILQSNATYAGNIGDVVTWAGVGTFAIAGLLTTVHPNDTILALMTSLTKPFSTPQDSHCRTGANQTWSAQPPTTVPSNTSQRVQMTNTLTGVAIGSPFTVHLSAPYTGPGTVGDTLFWFYPGPRNNYAMLSSTIVSVTNGGLTLTWLPASISGLVPAGGAKITPGFYDWVEAPLPTAPVAPLVAELLSCDVHEVLQRHTVVRARCSIHRW